LFGVIAGAGEGARLDVADAEALAERLPARELVRFDPAVDGEVVRRRAQVLADRDDVDADAGEVREAAATSATVSPIPSTSPDFVVRPAAFAAARTPRLRA